MRSIGTQCPRRPLGDKKNYQKKRADVRWNSCRTIMRTQRTSVGHSVPILRIRWNFMRTSAECPLDVRQNVRRMSARMSIGRPQNFRRTSAECPSHPPECPSDVRQNVRWMSVRMCRTSARMSNGCLSDVRNVRTEKCL